MPAFNDNDERFMRRALSLASRGRGYVEPNPMVGCVIVRGDRIIGEGFHERFGEPHAEPNALAACTESPAGATAYVTLEPCCHVGKKTPPCVPRLLEAKLARVVVGCVDPNPQVSGHGIEQLRAGGIAVDSRCLEAECRQLIAPFYARVSLNRPYVTLKWAESLNGMVAGRLGHPVHITSSASDRVVHELRAASDAIAVGTNTILNDDPLLTARGVESGRPLLRVLLSNSPQKIPLTRRLVATAKKSPVVLYCSATAAVAHASALEALRTAGVELLTLRDSAGHFSFADVLQSLHDRAVTHLLIEPGPVLARSLISRGHVDRIWVFRSPSPLNDQDGLRAATAPYPAVASTNLAGDTLTEYLNPTSAAFFAPVPSVDFLRAAKEPDSTSGTG